MKPNSPEFIPTLASRFSTELRSTLSAEQMQTVVNRNLQALAAGYDDCHSHDFCDANEVMASAFQAVAGREMDLKIDSDCAAWGKAWRLAKKSAFSL